MTNSLFANRVKPLFICFLLSLYSIACFSNKDDSVDLQQIMVGFLGNSFHEKASTVERLVSSGAAQTPFILKSLLKGQLYYRKSDKKILSVHKVDGLYEVVDPITNKFIGLEKKRELKKITINNTLRGKIRSELAALSLFSNDPQTRLQAIDKLIKDSDIDTLPILHQAHQQETHALVKKHLELAIAILEMSSHDLSVRIKAIQQLEGNLNPQVRNQLIALLDKSFQENNVNEVANHQVIQAAKKSIDKIETKLKFYEFIQTLFFGLGLGSVLVLAAIGLAITFGVMGVINMAHGELIMLGAYTTYAVQEWMPVPVDYSLFVALPLAFMVSALVGIIIQQSVIRFLQGRPLETLLATFGISLVLQQAVRSIFSPLNRSVTTPQWMSGSWEINAALSFTVNRLYIIAFTVIILFLLMMILKKTTLGLQVRAVAQNRTMARAMGVRSSWVDAMTFGLGSGIAGIAGVALSQLTNVGPNLGQTYIVDSFMVVVFGGVGNLWGTFLAGELLGIANKFLEPYTGAVLAKILILIFIILFIQHRPQGLFPQKGRAVES